jgi:hypothetical protein
MSDSNGDDNERLTSEGWEARKLRKKIETKTYRVNPKGLKMRVHGHNAKARQKLFEVMINDNLTPMDAARKLGIKREYAMRWYHGEEHYFARLKKLAPYLRFEAIRDVREAARTAKDARERVYAARALWEFANNIEGLEDRGGEKIGVTVNIQSISNNNLLAAALGISPASVPGHVPEVIAIEQAGPNVPGLNQIEPTMSDNVHYRSMGNEVKPPESNENLTIPGQSDADIDLEDEELMRFSLYSESEIDPENS